MALIDILVPCYQYGRHLPDCIASIASQSVQEWRVLIIDDASPDGSAEVAHRLAACDRRIQVIAHARYQGHIATYNEGSSTRPMADRAGRDRAAEKHSSVFRVRFSPRSTDQAACGRPARLDEDAPLKSSRRGAPPRSHLLTFGGRALLVTP